MLHRLFNGGPKERIVPVDQGAMEQEPHRANCLKEFQAKPFVQCMFGHMEIAAPGILHISTLADYGHIPRYCR